MLYQLSYARASRENISNPAGTQQSWLFEVSTTGRG